MKKIIVAVGVVAITGGTFVALGRISESNTYTSVRQYSAPKAPTQTSNESVAWSGVAAENSGNSTLSDVMQTGALLVSSWADRGLNMEQTGALLVSSGADVNQTGVILSWSAASISGTIGAKSEPTPATSTSTSTPAVAPRRVVRPQVKTVSTPKPVTPTTTTPTTTTTVVTPPVTVKPTTPVITKPVVDTTTRAS